MEFICQTVDMALTVSTLNHGLDELGLNCCYILLTDSALILVALDLLELDIHLETWTHSF